MEAIKAMDAVAVMAELEKAALFLEKDLVYDDEASRARLSSVISALRKGASFIESQETLIKAMLGEFGDSCDVDGCGSRTEQSG